MRSDNKGDAILSREAHTVCVGAPGFFPVRLWVDQGVTNKVVLQSVPSLGSGGYDEYEVLLGRETPFAYEESSGWREWYEYIAEIESRGYFTNHGFPPPLPIGEEEIEEALHHR
jgi:hypothetical protein